MRGINCCLGVYNPDPSANQVSARLKIMSDLPRGHTPNLRVLHQLLQTILSNLEIALIYCYTACRFVFVNHIHIDIRQEQYCISLWPPEYAFKTALPLIAVMSYHVQGPEKTHFPVYQEMSYQLKVCLLNCI